MAAAALRIEANRARMCTVNRRITRRQAVLSLASIGVSAFIKPASIFGVEPVKKKLRFAVIGDWGTGDGDGIVTAKRMIEAHERASFDFIITAGDNIYPNGSGCYFDKHFEQPFADIIRSRVPFYAVLGNHDV